MARHEGLRTRFVEDNGQVFAQVDAKAKISIEQQPWNGSDTELDAFVGQWARQLFELDQGQLLRGLLLRRSAQVTLVLVQHHIISDAASMQVMVQEWLSSTLLTLQARFRRWRPCRSSTATTRFGSAAGWRPASVSAS